MPTPSFREDLVSQLPALQLLQTLGFQYLSPAEAMAQRGSKATNVLLEGILEAQLSRINRIHYKKQEYEYSPANIRAGIQALKDVPMQEGYIGASKHVYDLLTSGQALEQSIAGDKKSFTLQYVDWHSAGLHNNVFHVTEEYSVMRSASRDHYRPDLVLFVNGIPLVVIECKRPDMKEPLEQAISQHLRNQQEDGIRPLYVYAQLLLSMATNQACYATNGTPKEFWGQWREEEDKALSGLKNASFDPAQQEPLFAERWHYVRTLFAHRGQEPLQVTEQDRYLYNLCRPERLLDLVFNFIVFDAGEKKVARYQQYFAIKKSMRRIRSVTNGKRTGGRRTGGVIWHTQGSGKSLTMVMLAQAIVLDKTIVNPKIILVTDRVDLDDQITATFQKCKQPVLNATTGTKLAEHLASKSDAVITTVINKFEAVVKKKDRVYDSPNIFVLVDEGHRSQHGIFHLNMQKTMPNACFIAFTGTPLMKREKSTAQHFGGMIDEYPMRQAVEDKAVVSILYEGRHAYQQVSENALDNYFELISESLTDYQRADLKKKYSRANLLNIADQKIYAIAWDISRHFRDTWQGTPFKGQLVCQNKVAAIRYHEYLNEIGLVSSAVIMSPPDTREGEDSAYAKSTDQVKQFWERMMQEHGTAKMYADNLISRYKNQDHPEIIIVVDKLLTGFDAPRNTVLYITRNLREHTLLQAIARVNRVFEGKDFGYVIDYFGITEQLGEALDTYAGFDEFDAEDLEGALVNIDEEIAKLPQAHSEVWDVFKEVANRYDTAAYEALLRDVAERNRFYDKLSTYARLLKMALSSRNFATQTPEAQQKRYRQDAKFFLDLRNSVKQRYSDAVDFRQYESQIQKLIDKHVGADSVQAITEQVNIFDQDKFAEEVEKVIGEAAKADTIASRTARHISERMDDDPAFYKKFSELLKETIQAYEEQRITEAEYLQKARQIMEDVRSRKDEEAPEALRGNEVAQAYYGHTLELLQEKNLDISDPKVLAAEIGLAIDEIIRQHLTDQGRPKVDWTKKDNLVGQVQIEIGDYLIDHVRDRQQVPLTFGDMDKLAEQCLAVAKRRLTA
ncbi:MAG: HsdR family type I site-specific deoxyribonuclease [Tunicatimonas sp.]